MKSAIFFVLVLICTFNNRAVGAEPSFMKYYFLDGTLSEIKSKYKGSLKNISCFSDVAKMCSAKKIKCSCFNVTLAFSQFFNKNLLFATANDKIVLFMDRTQVEPRFYNTQLETVSRWFENDKPTAIYEDSSSQYGYQAFQLLWQLNEGYVTSVVTCPVDNSKRKGLYTGSLKDCRVRTVKMSRIDKFAPPKDLKISKLSY